MLSYVEIYPPSISNSEIGMPAMTPFLMKGKHKMSKHGPVAASVCPAMDTDSWTVELKRQTLLEEKHVSRQHIGGIRAWKSYQGVYNVLSQDGINNMMHDDK